jgi:thiamine biosynthesis lipoprotein
MNTFPEFPDWHTRTFRAMGSEIALWLDCDDPDEADDALYQAEALFYAAERRLTRFSPDSELGQLNARPEQWVLVSNIFWDVITQALLLAEETNGMFDPTLLNALESAGYKNTFAEMGQELLILPQGDVGKLTGRWQDVGLNAGNKSIYLPATMRLDLGGIGKGYTAQQVVNFLSHWGGCLVDAGGDLTAGDAPLDMLGWSVALSAPCQDEVTDPEDLLQIWLANSSLATSGIDYRRWRQNGVARHHLIDPRTGCPADTDVLTATILSDSAVHAEAWATATLIAGISAGKQTLESKQIAGALIDTQHNLTLTTDMTPHVCQIA